MFKAARAWQQPWREYPGQDNIAIPPDYQEKTEWAFARLMYPPCPGVIHNQGPRGRGDWRNGRSTWTTDYTAQRVFPDREIVDIPDKDAIFHTIYDLDGRYQLPGAQYLRSGVTYEYDGYDPHWRGIYDNKGRLVVAIRHDMDLGDAWEFADDPRYDEKFAALAFRIVSNYVVYSMSH